MDPLTAFSLACGILQVLDFSAKLLSQCREIYKKGSFSENDEIETITTHLSTLNTDMQPPSSPTSSTQTVGDKELMQLSEKCSELAKELVAELQSLKVGGSGSRWRAVGGAVRNLRKKGTIERLQGRLEECKRVLDTKVLVDLRLVRSLLDCCG